MNKRESAQLHHMLEAAQTAVSFTKNRRRNDLDQDEQLALAVTRLLEIVGEAAKAVIGEAI